ncbi:MAG: proline dehydrogenase family protein [Planctomycetota bacterium]|nr:proline dehydrogenase family protein [Planctomycetota bacterium]
MGIFHQLATATLPLIPRPIMRKLAGRYIAGETLEQALGCLENLQAQGFTGILDLLGEDVQGEAEARAVLAEYKEGATQIAKRGLDAYVSVKPTHFCLQKDANLAFELYDDLLTHCSGLGQRVRVEMEDHPTTDDTLALFAKLRAKHIGVGLVLQARLFRNPADIAALPEPEPGGRMDIRMVKGIYLEPEEIAHTKPDPIRAAFIEQCKTLWAGGHFVAIATHDEVMAETLMEHVERENIPRELYDFEVLLGVRESLWQSWLKQGRPVRVYVPYGPEWRAYSQRRLRKNPEMLKAVAMGMFRR